MLPIIPARGGSKGLPRKNILPLAGKPLIYYSIKAALDAGEYCLPPIVSTDDPKIIKVAKGYNALTPFVRPKDLATDEVSIFPVLTHALLWFEENENYSPDYILLLQPTSPMRTAEDIKSSIKLAIQHDADGVVSVCESQHHPYLAKKIINGQVDSFLNLDRIYNRRQELPEAYALNGAIYLVKSEILKQMKTFYTDKTYAYIMPRERSIDIDSLWDLQMCEWAITTITC